MAQLADATNRFNRHQIGLLAKNVLSKLPPGGKVGILGLSYKPNTDVVEESQSILLARILMRRKVSLKLYDPVAIPNAKRIFNDEKLFASSAKECIRQSDLVIIATPWDEFRDIPSSYFIKAKRRHVVIDCWRILDSDKYKDVIDYIPLGIGLINKNRKTK
jgi:UDPglucose 6-dehydrogenase